MRALSFWQPYAWFIVNGHADVDSRLWTPPANYLNTRIAVHASKRKVTKLEYDEFLKTVKKLKIKIYPMSPNEFHYGKIVGTVIIAGVTQKAQSPFAAWYYHWLLISPRTILPVDVVGHRGWFTWE